MESKEMSVEVQAVEGFRKELKQIAEEYYFNDKGQNILSDDSPENIEKFKKADERVREIIRNVEKEGIIPEDDIVKILDEVLGKMQKMENKE